MPSPTALTLRALRASGYTAEPVERYIAAVNVRKDWGGFGDVLAAGRGEIVLVQATTAGHVSHRLAKAKSRPELRAWLAAGGKFWVMGWHKVADRWKVRRVEVLAGDADLQAIEVEPRRRTRRPKQKSLFD